MSHPELLAIVAVVTVILLVVYRLGRRPAGYARRNGGDSGSGSDMGFMFADSSSGGDSGDCGGGDGGGCDGGGGGD